MLLPNSPALLVLFIILASEAVAPLASAAQSFYVSPDGNNSNAGTRENPWQTLAYALGKLSPGDTLYLRGGIYYEREITINLKGTTDAPITIQSYPGERALIDGGIPDFKSVPNSEWELVNESIKLYRSKRTYSADYVRAWLIDDDVQLVEYSTDANLETTYYGPANGTSPLYIGPGVQRRSDGRIYIRLQPNPNDLTDASGKPIPTVPADPDPNRNKIALFMSEHIFKLDGAEYLHFKEISFAHSRRIIDARNGSHHIEFDQCALNFGTYGLVIRDTVRDWKIHHSEFNNGLPEFVYWTDVKNTNEVAEAYPEFQSVAIDGPIPTFNVYNNVFRNMFDAFHVDDGTRDTRIAENVFKNIRDDAMELTRAIGNVEIDHNLFWHVGSGISIVPSDGSAGSVHIHHNVIDNSAYQHGGRTGNSRAINWSVWTTIDPFSSHGSGNKAAWWKIYNNTIVTRRSGYSWNGAGPGSVTGNPEKYVYNNIFYIIDDRVVLRDDLASTGSRYDGNVMFRKAPGRFPLFVSFGDGRDYASLSSFQQNSGVNWEARGLEIDPGFNISVIDDPTIDLATIWNRYRPTNSRVFTPGVSYAGLNWPGTREVFYRGALPPPNIYIPEILKNLFGSPTCILTFGENCAMP